MIMVIMQSDKVTNFELDCGQTSQVIMHSIKSRGGLTRGGGIDKTVRTIWICSSHCYAGIQKAMTNLTNIKR